MSVGLEFQRDRVLVVGGAHDCGSDGGYLGFGTVDFQPDFHAVHVAVIADFAQAGGDVLNGGFMVHTLGEAVGAHLDTEGARIVGETDEILGERDLLLTLGSVGG
jgi:hypothetical protein